MIPKTIHHIWVGHKPAPLKWMTTWTMAHPEWSYRLWTNHDLRNGKWRNQRHMMEYFARQRYDGVADLMRYEILLREGGIVVAADSVCLHPLDDLFLDGHELYAISTDMSPYGKEIPGNHGATTPLYAATPGHWFTKELVERLHELRWLGAPARTTGNRFMQRMLKVHCPEIKVWPLHLFIPEHFNGWRYSGPDRIYAKHFWGTTRGTYACGQ